MVITLCGIHQALPVASSQHEQQPQSTALLTWLHTAVAAQQQYLPTWLAHVVSLPDPSYNEPVAVGEQGHIYLT